MSDPHPYYPHPNDSSLSAFLSGAIFGAAITYLFGTKSGRKLKDELIKEAAKALEEVGEMAEEAKDEFESVKKEASKKIEEGKKEIKEKIAQGEKIVEEKVDQAKVTYDAAKEALDAAKTEFEAAKAGYDTTRTDSNPHETRIKDATEEIPQSQQVQQPAQKSRRFFFRKRHSES